MIRTDARTIKRFKESVREHYSLHGRALPWRLTHDPYSILVSEIMLQQTQVDRVIPKYQAFLEAFPTVRMLAGASLLDVLKLWQGLGYNRRGKALWQAAQMIVRDFDGQFPDSRDVLMSLPGVGPYTAGAVMAFAFDAPVVFIETNIRTVFIHHFFQDVTAVDDRDILPLVEKTLDRQDARSWYYALMDYGSFLKKTHGSSNQRSSQYHVQSRFQGSKRQVRGAVIRALSSGQSVSMLTLVETLGVDESLLHAILEELVKEAMIERCGSKFRIP